MNICSSSTTARREWGGLQTEGARPLLALSSTQDAPLSPHPEDELPSPVRPIAPILPPGLMTLAERPVPITLGIIGPASWIPRLLMVGQCRQGAADKQHRAHRQNQDHAFHRAANLLERFLAYRL